MKVATARRMVAARWGGGSAARGDRVDVSGLKQTCRRRYDHVDMPPFDAISIPLAGLWPDDVQAADGKPGDG